MVQSRCLFSEDKSAQCECLVGALEHSTSLYVHTHLTPSGSGLNPSCW